MVSAGKWMATAADRAEQYRDKARRLRLLAATTRYRDTGARLIALAESFEVLAERVEAWESLERPDAG